MIKKYEYNAKTERNEQIKNDRAKGMKYREIAEKYSVTCQNAVRITKMLERREKMFDQYPFLRRTYEVSGNVRIANSLERIGVHTESEFLDYIKNGGIVPTLGEQGLEALSFIINKKLVLGWYVYGQGNGFAGRRGRRIMIVGEE